MNTNVKFLRIRNDGDICEYNDILIFAEELNYYKRMYDGEVLPYKFYIETNNDITRFELT